MSEHKIVIGSTEFDYDAMTVTTDKESLVLPKKQFLNSCFYISLQLRQAEHLQNNS